MKSRESHNLFCVQAENFTGCEVNLSRDSKRYLVTQKNIREGRKMHRWRFLEIKFHDWSLRDGDSSSGHLERNFFVNWQIFSPKERTFAVNFWGTREHPFVHSVTSSCGVRRHEEKREIFLLHFKPCLFNLFIVSFMTTNEKRIRT